MNINDLDPGEKAAIRTLQRLSKRWPKSLTLTALFGSLHVGHGDDGIDDITIIHHIPVGAGWPMTGKVDRWVYTFSVEQRPSMLKQEDAVRLLLGMGRVFDHGHRMTFDERGWELFRDSAARAGMRLVNISRTPEMPAEDVL